jgi:small subunit ribosomal protein S8
MMTDPIADMLTRIRNAVRVRKPTVDVPSSRMKASIAAVLKREGFIGDFKVVEEGLPGMIRVFLKYGRRGESVIQEIHRVSKPGRRVYMGVSEMEPILRGIGVTVVSTARGILSDRECRRDHIGGEVLCTVW